MRNSRLIAACLPALMWAGSAAGQDVSGGDLKADLARARAQIDQQQHQLGEQEQRLRALEARINAAAASPAPVATRGGTPPAPAIVAAQASASAVPGDPAGALQAPVGPVGEAPADTDRPPEVAVLGNEGSVVTRKGQLTAEMQLDYARADRNRAIFRGIEVVESVLVGVFDINESRQDVLTATGSLRYGLFDNLEVGVRLPYVYRSDKSVLAPIAGSTTNDAAATVDTSADGNGIGDLELSARYQLRSARGGSPFVIGNLQVVAPTGTDPFDVPRTANGAALKSSTGAGFWAVSPSLTAILPTDPAVLFGTIGYTRNFGHGVDTEIPPVRLTYVKPGDAISFSAGIGVSLNQRTSLNLGYAHSWAFGTKTRTEALLSNGTWSNPTSAKSRDLQIGRFLFGVTYRAANRTSVNWSVEVGATADAPDVRTVVRIPLLVFGGRR